MSELSAPSASSATVEFPTVADIIKRAGGAPAIETASDGEVKAGAVYKWPKIGVPDRHWPLLMRLSGASADELLTANIAARTPNSETPQS